ncbi:MAG: cytochrome c family protein [Myxococcales bacterium]|nr:cytochrome c family protein [Myxococcales bacterium]
MRLTGSRFALGIVVSAAGCVGALAGLAGASPGGVRDGGVSVDAAPRAPVAVLAAPLELPPSALIFPAQVIPLRFDHARHLKLSVKCETCHVSASTSTSAADNLIPAEAACRQCHEIDRARPTLVPAGGPAARCDACHVGDTAGWMPRGATFSTPPRVELARPNLKFNHRLHVSRGVGCELCHGNVATKAFATRDDLPKMALCLGCHDGKQATSRCAACHLTEPDGRLKTSLASAATAALGPAGLGKLVPSGVLRGLDAHGPMFARDHAQVGRQGETDGYCLSCHKRSECVDCHGGVVRPFDIHPSDYVSLHGVDARRNTPDCSSCHRAQSFCVGCHQRTGVAADPEGGGRGQQPRNPFGTGTQLKQFHPPGWVGEGGATSGHAQQARRNIRACASCHREESCLGCHSTDPTRGMNVSPHGPAFGGTARCRALSQKNRRACLKCHALGAAEIDCEMP